MTDIELFAFVILPLSIAAAGAAIGYFYVRWDERKDHMHPGE